MNWNKLTNCHCLCNDKGKSLSKTVGVRLPKQKWCPFDGWQMSIESLTVVCTWLSSPSWGISRCWRRPSSSSCHGARSCWRKPVASQVTNAHIHRLGLIRARCRLLHRSVIIKDANVVHLSREPSNSTTAKLLRRQKKQETVSRN